MTGDLTRALTEIRHGTVARLLLADLLHMAEREGILQRMRGLSPFSHADLCRTLERDLGYALEQGNRRRMICLMLSLLHECGWVREAGGVWTWGAGDSPPIPGSGDGTLAGGQSPAADDQYRFFTRCLESVPGYLRGGHPSFMFDENNAEAWELFLGCAEFRICRSLLLELMGIQNQPSFHLLDLCHGPGWGLEAALSRFPATHITALDFTEVFSRKAKARAERARACNRRLGHAGVPIAWLGPDRWKGFGDSLPFAEHSFDAVFFSCGDPYIPRNLRGEVYREIARVLVPEGKLGILTRCRPDAGARHIPSYWLRISALVHDFAESVCEGWEGFSDAEENLRVFSDAGFLGGVSLLGSMSLLESSLWVLRKRRSHG
ncbi:MAG TPA: class I SAM-dependent methyltransferase [Candidatus Methylomirabilis sp.]|nr:class I SAM-dependent methyltransferase [Candidatus Methylomirabilis sp.]